MMSRMLMTGDGSSTSSGTLLAEGAAVVFVVDSVLGLRCRTLAADILTGNCNDQEDLVQISAAIHVGINSSQGAKESPEF
jgi:hypothetical protein